MICHALRLKRTGIFRECEGDEGADYEDADSDTGW